MPSDMQMSAEDKAREERFQIEQDLRTLAEADAIRRDKKRLNRARKFAREQAESVGAKTVLTPGADD